MKPVIWLSSSCALILIHTGCVKQPPISGPGTGPYDSAGNYVEEWADDPTKWSKPGDRHKETPGGEDLPVIARNEQPPANANPLTPQSSSRRPAPVQVKTLPRETSRHPEGGKVVTTKSKPTVKEKTTSTTVKTKPKPKSKPKSTYHTVKKGDSLWTLAKKYNTTIPAIQKANGLSGTMIRDGRKLVIPKR